MSDALFGLTQRLVIENAKKLHGEIKPSGNLKYDLGECWDMIVSPVDACLTTIKIDGSAELAGALEEGMHVLIFGAGQIIRESRRQNNSDFFLTQRRVLNARHIFSAIASLPNDDAVEIESRIGFKSHTFEHPTSPLQFNNEIVSVPDEPLLNTEANFKQGCPFKSHMLEMYPIIAHELTTIFARSEITI